MARGIYSVIGEDQTPGGAVTLLELTAPSTAVLELLRAWCHPSSGSAVTTSAQQRVQLLRKTATITGTASPPTPRAFDASASSGATAKWIATAEGTDGNILDAGAFNILGGMWEWSQRTARSRILVPPSAIIAIKLPAAPPVNVKFSFGIEYEEIG